MERVWQRQYANRTEAKSDIAACIAGLYSSERLHSVLANLPPSVSERNNGSKTYRRVQIYFTTTVLDLLKLGTMCD